LGVVPLVSYLGTAPGPSLVRRTVGSARPWLMLGAGILALLATTPSIVLAPGEVIDWLGIQASMYGSYESAVGRGLATPNGLGVTIADAAGGTGPILILAGVIGVAGLFLSRRWITIAMGALIVAYAAILAVPVLHYARNALPLVPYIAIGIGLLPGHAARGLGRLANARRASTQGTRVIVVALVTLTIAIALIPPVAGDVAAVRRSRATDTRTIAYTWILDHLPHNAIVAREEYTPQLPAGQFRLRNHDRLYQRNMEWYRQLRVRYVVTSSDIYMRFLDNPATPLLSDFYRTLFSFREVFRIDPAGRRNGPTIRIFELPATAS